MRKSKTLFLIIVLLLISTGAFFAFQTFGEEKNPAVPEPAAVKVAPVVSGNASATESFSGFVQGANQTSISPKTSGYIIKMLKEEGDFVKAGETVAILDGSELSAAKKAALSNLEATQKNTETTSEYYDQVIDAAKTNLKKVENDHSTGNATKQDVKNVEESVKSAKKLRDSQLSNQQGLVTQAEGQALISTTNAQNIFITAPSTGMITQKNVSLGMLVSPGTVIYALASPTELEVNLAIPARVAKNLVKNLPVTITDPANEKNVSGSIFSISSALGQTTQQASLRVRFTASTDMPRFSLGEYVLIHLPQEKMESALIIPELAVSYEYDNSYVFVVENNIATKRLVTLGKNIPSGQIISSGLKENELVIIEGLHNLRNEALVKIYENK